MAAVRPMHDTVTTLREGTPPDRLEGMAGDELMKRVMRNDDYARWSQGLALA
jgi:carboxyvinyl-carboxyphosphonate phosphorylmutase